MLPAMPHPYLGLAHRLADAAGAAIRPYFRSALVPEDKGKGPERYDPVTLADRAAEAAMRAILRQEQPGHAIWGEEEGRTPGGPETWVLDPIDGTRSFICGFPTWGTLIAFNDGSGPTLGILDQPILHERLVGAEGQAWLGDQRLATRPCASLSEAVLFATTPDMFAGAALPAFEDLAERVRLRRFGGDCYAYGMLALGLVDLVVEAALAPWDIQALVPIVEGAGGVVTTWTGERPDDGGRIIAAGDRRLHAEVVRLLEGTA
jgi:myo-inositol-1(or 4)-monophosphatase